MNDTLFKITNACAAIDGYFNIGVIIDVAPPVELISIIPKKDDVSNELLKEMRDALKNKDEKEAVVVNQINELSKVATAYNGLKRLDMHHAEYVRKRNARLYIPAVQQQRSN